MTKHATISFRTYKNHHLTERMLHNKMRAGTTGDLTLRLATACSSHPHREAGALTAPTGCTVGVLRRVSEIPEGVEKGVPLPVELIDYDMQSDTWLFTVSI